MILIQFTPQTFIINTAKDVSLSSHVVVIRTAFLGAAQKNLSLIKVSESNKRKDFNLVSFASMSKQVADAGLLLCYP